VRLGRAKAEEVAVAEPKHWHAVADRLGGVWRNGVYVCAELLEGGPRVLRNAGGVVVDRPIESRVGAPAAATCYVDYSPPVVTETGPGMMRIRGEGRPTGLLTRYRSAQAIAHGESVDLPTGRTGRATSGCWAEPHNAKLSPRRHRASVTYHPRD
jgi:hypothetical protein